jgi:hypothetical protein
MPRQQGPRGPSIDNALSATRVGPINPAIRLESVILTSVKERALGHLSSSLGLSICSMYPSAWKTNSQKFNFRFTEFSEVERPLLGVLGNSAFSSGV